MRFDTLTFVLAFLPLVVIGFHAMRLRGQRGALVFLAAASLVFYGWWDVTYVPLIVGSVLVNYLLGQAILKGGSGPLSAGGLLTCGVVFNLGLIAVFKYAGFFAGTADALLGLGWTVPAIILPLAISFFTFQQIAFLADVRAGKIRRVGFLEYAVFVLFFPQLIAGPIVHFVEVAPQFRRLARLDRSQVGRLFANLSIGLGIFSIGLFKKTVFSDELATYVDPAFAAAGDGAVLTFFEAWAATLSFTFQIYFDFSGYSDMAIGLARMFGIKLPLNFAAPYKATNIVEFWRCWHMTLSRFLRDYLYIPLGGNRHGKGRRYVNLMITMLLGGLWHGAAWTFVAWGALHGAYLVVCHAWHWAKRRAGLASDRSTALGRALGRSITFLVVAIAWVPFRAEDFGSAQSILSSLAGLNGLSLPADLEGGFGGLAAPLGALGLGFAPSPLWMGAGQWIWLIGLLFIVWYCPTTQDIFARVQPTLRDSGARLRLQARFTWSALRSPGGWLALLSRGLLVVVAAAMLAAWVPPAQSEGQGLAFKLAALLVLAFGIASLRFSPRINWRPGPSSLAIWSTVLTIDLFMLYRAGGGAFIYFQF